MAEVSYTNKIQTPTTPADHQSWLRHLRITARAKGCLPALDFPPFVPVVPDGELAPEPNGVNQPTEDQIAQAVKMMADTTLGQYRDLVFHNENNLYNALAEIQNCLNEGLLP